MGLLNDMRNTPYAKRKEEEFDKLFEDRYAFTEKYAPENPHENIFGAFLWLVFIFIPITVIDIYLHGDEN